MENTKENGFVAWEYVNVSVRRNHAPLYIDCYQNFGWTLLEQVETSWIPNMAAAPYSTGNEAPVGHNAETVALKFKRDSRLPNRIQLSKLQQECMGALTSMQKLEGKKSAYQVGPTIGFGMVGTAALALSIYSFTTGNIPLCVLFAVVSLASWAAAGVAAVAVCIIAAIVKKVKSKG